jgi:hypothetical protein
VKRRGSSLNNVREGQAQAAAHKRKLLERLKAHPPTKSSAPCKVDRKPVASLVGLDVDQIMAAAERLRLTTLDMQLGVPTPLNRPTLVLLRGFLEALSTRESAVVLQWPFGQPDVSLLHPLAMVACLCAPARKTTGKYVWCDPPYSFRTLYFP